MGVKALICLWFIAITSPTAAHAIARGAHRAGYKLWGKSVQDDYAADGEAWGGTKPEPKETVFPKRTTAEVQQ